FVVHGDPEGRAKQGGACLRKSAATHNRLAEIERSSPISMIDSSFPKDLLGFLDKFKTDEDCREYILKVRWPDGFVCPGKPDSSDPARDPSARRRIACQNTTGWWHARRDIWTCSKCG